MIPEGQISFPINMEGKKVVVTFIMVSSFLHNDFGKAVDSHNGGHSIHLAYEG